MIVNVKAFNILKFAINILLIVLNITLISLLYVQFGSNLFYKGIWIAIGIITVFIQIFSLMVGKGAEGRKKVLPLIGYVFGTMFSLTGTLSFTLSELDKTKDNKDVIAYVNTTQQSDLATSKGKIDGLTQDQNRLRSENSNEKTPSWKKDINEKLIAKKQIEIDTESDNLKKLQKERLASLKGKSSEQKASNAFDLLAQALSIFPWWRNLQGDSVKSFLMLVISFIFEYFIFFTAEPLKEKKDTSEGDKNEEPPKVIEKIIEKEKEPLIIASDKEDLTNYISLLFKEDKTLRTSEEIVAMSNLSLETCEHFKSSLLHMSYKGKKLLFIDEAGNLKWGYDKADMDKVIQFRLNYAE